jgi:uncharacterized protein (TIGR02118 family)
VVKLVALYRHPQDPQGWMQRFLTTVEPAFQALPGLQRLELSQPAGDAGAGDRRGPPFLMAELYFADQAALDQAILAPQGEILRSQFVENPDREAQIFVAHVR